jgi:hypothetical protein
LLQSKMNSPDPALFSLDRSVDEPNEGTLQLDDFSSFNFIPRDNSGSLDAIYADMGIDPLAALSEDYKFEIPAESIEASTGFQDEAQQQADEANTHFSPANVPADASHTAIQNDAGGPLPNGMKFESNDPPLFTASPEQSPQTPLKISTPSAKQQGMSSSSHFQPVCQYAASTPSSFEPPSTQHEATSSAPQSFHNPFTPDCLPVNNRINHLAHPIPQTGRRRSQSMPPPEFSFHRRLNSGNVLSIGNPVHQRHVTAHAVPRHHPYGNAVARFRDPRAEGMVFDEPWSYPASPVPDMYGHYHATDAITAPSSPAGLGMCDEFGAQPQGLQQLNKGMRAAGHKRGVSTSPARHDDPYRRRTRGTKTSSPVVRRAGPGAAGPDPRAYAENGLGLEGVERAGVEGLSKADPSTGNALDMYVLFPIPPRDVGQKAKTLIAKIGCGTRNARRTIESKTSISRWRCWRAVRRAWCMFHGPGVRFGGSMVNPFVLFSSPLAF